MSKKSSKKRIYPALTDEQRALIHQFCTRRMPNPNVRELQRDLDRLIRCRDEKADMEAFAKQVGRACAAYNKEMKASRKKNRSYYRSKKKDAAEDHKKINSITRSTFAALVGPALDVSDADYLKTLLTTAYANRFVEASERVREHDGADKYPVSPDVYLEKHMGYPYTLPAEELAQRIDEAKRKVADAIRLHRIRRAALNTLAQSTRHDRAFGIKSTK